MDQVRRWSNSWQFFAVWSLVSVVIATLRIIEGAPGFSTALAIISALFTAAVAVVRWRDTH